MFASFSRSKSYYISSNAKCQALFCIILLFSEKNRHPHAASRLPDSVPCLLHSP